MFWVVLVFWLCASGCAYVLALCFGLGFCFGHGFVFRVVIFLLFLFFSSSLVLMGTVGLWLCSDFYGFDGGCGCVLVVE